MAHQGRPPGHWIVHLGLALVCLTRAFAYSDWLTPPIDSPGPIFLTDDGQWLWVYALLWLAAGLVAAWDGIRGRTGWGVPIFIGITAVWGGSYAGAWWVSDLQSPDWLTAALYWGTSLAVAGGHLTVSHLEEQLARYAEEMRQATGPIEVRSRPDDD